MSDAHKNPPEEIRKKQSVAMSGRKWWNDGCGNVKLMIECPGDGWKLGMKPNGIKNEMEENAEVGFDKWLMEIMVSSLAVLNGSMEIVKLKDEKNTQGSGV